MAGEETERTIVTRRFVLATVFNRGDTCEFFAPSATQILLALIMALFTVSQLLIRFQEWRM